MNLFRRDWTPAAADEWTVHDLAACVLGVASFFLISIGLVGAILLEVWGFVCTAGALVCLVLMYRIIDPKLRALSDAFEARQSGYLEELEKSNRWEANDGN